ncbi:MAG: hypothetical protein H0W40_01485 [Methylibium sp.]|uniref:hypothetical protein n=1 Tax=Methylibium sp. TaxID=2067992 RepID=UPI0017EF5518|nr:hypothetical protein [Methylibium sp.]MBA3596040.1 hypothetical protein [Methylibium sp.]
MELNHELQRRRVGKQLKQYIAEGSFVSRVYNAIGSQLHFILVEWPDEDEVAFSLRDPMNSLQGSLLSGWTFDHGWIASNDGSYTDDNGAKIPDDVPASCSSVELLAAYGLWFVETEFFALGLLRDSDYNEHGFTYAQVQQHQCACLLLAHEAVLYAKEFIDGSQLSPADIEEAISRRRTPRPGMSVAGIGSL